MKFRQPIVSSQDHMIGRARSLRKRMTKVERIIWQELRGKKLKGYYFRRQHPIGWYVADFYCAELNLVIEIDGPVHDKEQQKLYDLKRDQFMIEQGLTVVRIKAGEVYENLDKVMARIELRLP